jgi:hypothetical protein
MTKISIVITILLLAGCGSTRETIRQEKTDKQYQLSTNTEGKGPELIIDFRKGESFYYPLMVFWLEDMDRNYIQTLYVARSVATGIYKYGSIENKKWVEAPRRAPQTLPFWAHKRGVKASDGLYMPEPENPVADAYTGATPTSEFVLTTKADKSLPVRFRVMMEINQNWDWNQYWTNSKFPGDQNYAMSAQPAVVYEAIVDSESGQTDYFMKPVGHSHYSGKNGELFTDLGTLTSALRIAASVKVTVAY